ncbi:HAMP domain-containing protein [bacterium]|nr:HAMP domain-containing protein [bacterium]
MRLSIRYKILGVTGMLLAAAVVAYTLLASSIFIEEKTALLYDLNHSIAVNSSAQISASLGRLGEQTKLYAVARLAGSQSALKLSPPGQAGDTLRSWGLFVQKGGAFEAYSLPANYPALPETGLELQGHLAQAAQNGQAFWRSEKKGNPFLLATRLDLTSSDKYISVAEIDSKPLFDILLNATVFESYLVDSKGTVLAHFDRDEEQTTLKLVNHPLLGPNRSPSHLSGVQSYEFEGKRWYGAFAPIGAADLFFISQAGEKEVDSALLTLLQRSSLFGLIVLTVTFIASILFSKSLTKNLQRLAAGVASIGAGNLQAQIRIHSGDEVEALAGSFNEMVTALRSSREEIENYNRELEGKVADRTRELVETNALIKSVQEKLLEATKFATVGEVAGRTAHELLNPLTAILARLDHSATAVAAAGPSAPAIEILNAWNADYARGGLPALNQALSAPSTALPGKTLLEEDLQNLKTLAQQWQEQSSMLKKDIHFVKEQAQRIHRIVDKMRERVRDSSKAPTPCRAAAEEAVATMSDFLSKQGTQIQLEWNADQDLAELNRDELIQILTNLIRNGYQAIPKGSAGKITVRSGNHGHLLWIDVVDNGQGISAQDVPRLFDQGFTTKPASEGTGLGLSICRRYAHAFGGEVELLYSEAVKGTCFRVTIPLKTGAAA